METLKANWKRYLISSLVTFVSAFLLFAVPEFLREDFAWETGAIGAVLITATRLGVKAVWELLQPVIAGIKK